MNNKPTEEEAKKAIEVLEAVDNYQVGEYVDIGTYAAEHFDEVYIDIAPEPSTTSADTIQVRRRLSQ